MYNSHPDYLEEMNYGWESEDNRLFALSRMELEADDSGKINALVAAGRFVVVRVYPVFCQHTDAFLADRQQLISQHSSRAAAESRAARVRDAEGPGDWEGIEVLPSNFVREPVILSPLADDEIPF
jgi:hypothetical protein